MSELASLASALFSDILSSKASTVASLGGAALNSTLNTVLKKRSAAAREIFLDEIRRGYALPVPEGIDETVAILYRYWRAAQEGSGRLNLRLLAAVYAGQARSKAIVADEFLYYADLLASLRRDEIILLGTFLRHSMPSDGMPKDDYKLQFATMSELVPAIFPTHDDFLAALGALQRTGLITSYAIGGAVGGGSSTVYRVTNLLRKLNGLAEIEQVITRHNEDASA